MNAIPLAVLFPVLATLVLTAAFFAASGTSLAALNRQRIAHLSQRGHRGARRIRALLEQPFVLTALVMAGHHLANLLAAATTVVIAIRIAGDPDPMPLLAAIALLGLVVVLCVELLPRSLAARHPERVAFPASLVLTPLVTLARLLLWLPSRLRQWRRHRGGRAPMSVDDLHHLINEASPLVPLQHQRLLRSIISLVPVTVDALMVPRQDIAGLDWQASDQSLAEQIRRNPYSRLPVYRDDINQVEGVISWRGAHRCLAADGSLDRAALKQAIEPAYFIPEGTPLHVQLNNFLISGHRLGLVVDEYGDIEGLLTLEDLVAEIATELRPPGGLEAAADSGRVVVQNDGSYLLRASLPIRTVNRLLGWRLPTSGPHTLSGLLLEHLESLPVACVGLRIGPYHFEIAELQGNRIRQVRAWHGKQP